MSQTLELSIEVNDDGSATVKNFGQALADTGKTASETEGKMNTLEQCMGKSDDTMSGLITTIKGVGAAMALWRLERAIEGWVALSNAQDQADRSLKAAMVTNGRFSENFYQSIIQQAEALQRLTGIKAQDIERGQKMLMLYDSISNETMPRATRVMLNLAALMEGDARMAAMQLGKAMEGQAESLRRVGIVIDENVYKQRGAIGVLEEVEKKVKGQAETLAEGSGKWRLLGTQTDEAKESIGRLVTTIADRMGIIESLIWDVNKLVDAFKAVNGAASESKGVAKQLEDLKKWREWAENETDPGIGSWERVLFDFDERIIDKQFAAIERYYQKKVKEILASVASGPSLAEQILTQTKNPDQLAEESMKSIMDAAGKIKPIIDSQAEERERKEKETAEKIVKLNEGLTQKLNELTLSQYDYKKLLIDKELENVIKLHGDIKKATQIHNLELEKLDKEFLDKRESWRKLYAENRTPLTSLPDEYIDTTTLESADYAFKNLTQWNDNFERKVKDVNEGLKDYYEQQKKIQQQWEQTADFISGSLSSAIIDSLNGEKDAFKNFFNTIKDYFLKMALEKIISDNIKKGIDDAINYMNSKQSTSSGSSGGLSSFWGMAMPIAALGYDAYLQTKAGNMSPEKGALYGGFIGTILNPGIGTIFGAGIGAAFGGALGMGSKYKIPSIELLFDNIDNQIKLVSDQWSHTSKSQELIDQVQTTLQTQINFFSKISKLTSDSTAKLPTSFSGRSAVDILRQLNIGNVIGMSAHYFDLIDLFPGLGEQIKNLWNQTFTSDQSDVKLISGQLPSQMFEMLFGPNAIQDAEERSNIISEWLQSTLGAYSPALAAKEWQRRGPDAGYFNMKVQDLLSAQDAQSWTDLFNTVSSKILEIQQNLAQGIGNAFLDSIDTTGMQGFGDSLEKFLYEKVKAGLVQGFTNDVIDKVMMSGTGMMSAFGLLDQYVKGEGGVTLEDVTSAFIDAGGRLGTILETIKPIFDIFNQSLQSVSEALGLNTSATTANTSAVLEPVNNFLMSLDTGPLAPTQSLAGMMAQYNQLYSAALADPSKFSALSGYVGGSFLQGLQRISPDYVGTYAGVKSQILGLKTAWGSPSLDTAVSPADYAMPTTAGQTQGPGFKQMMKEALKEILEPLLMDIANATKEDKQLTGSIEITGNLGKLVAWAIKNDAEAHTEAHNA